jgi:hypothetical protein
MNWMHYAEAVVASVVACTFTDWFFMGILFHDKYKAHPEVWRDAISQGGESKAIAWATALSVVTCAAFVALCAAFAMTALSSACALAIGIWLVAPLPLLVSNSFFIKFHPLVTVSQALGWLAKLLVCALCVAYLL